MIYNVVLVSGIQQSDLVLCIYIYYICICSFSDSFPLEGITKYWVQFPVLYSRSLLVICFIYGNVYMLIPNSWFILGWSLVISWGQLHSPLLHSFTKPASNGCHYRQISMYLTVSLKNLLLRALLSHSLKMLKKGAQTLKNMSFFMRSNPSFWHLINKMPTLQEMG